MSVGLARIHPSDCETHAIALNGSARLDSSRRETYRCTLAGPFATPPEDCGGVPGYGEFVQAMANPDDPEHNHLAEWVGTDTRKPHQRRGELKRGARHPLPNPPRSGDPGSERPRDKSGDVRPRPRSADRRRPPLLGLSYGHSALTICGRASASDGRSADN